MLTDGDKASADDLVFKALASGTRRRMLDTLKEAPCTTGALCSRFPELDRTTVLQHLRVLEDANLVTGRKIGRERQLTLAPLPIKRIHDRWIDGYMHAAVELLDRLDRGSASTETSPAASHAVKTNIAREGGAPTGDELPDLDSNQEPAG